MASGPFLKSPEKPFVKLWPAHSYLVKGIQLKITAKFRASRPLRFEDTKRIMSPEMRPKSFGTYEKRAPTTSCPIEHSAGFKEGQKSRSGLNLTLQWKKKKRFEFLVGLCTPGSCSSWKWKSILILTAIANLAFTNVDPKKDHGYSGCEHFGMAVIVYTTVVKKLESDIRWIHH